MRKTSRESRCSTPMANRSRQLSGRFMFVDRDGSIYHSGNQLALVWKFKGVDGQGVPAYEFPRDMIFTAKDPIVPSPYFADKTEDLRCASTARLAPDGGICAGINLHYTPNGMGLSNSGATDLALERRPFAAPALRDQRLQPDPRDRAISGRHDFELGASGRIYGARRRWFGAGPIRLSGCSELERVLGRSSHGMGRHATADGNVQVIIGDYMQNCHHWMTVRNVPAVRKSRQEIVIAPAKARELAYRPPVLHQRIGQATAPEIVIKKLGGPLAIDGQMQKWRCSRRKFCSPRKPRSAKSTARPIAAASFGWRITTTIFTGKPSCSTTWSASISRRAGSIKATACNSA